jgi:hypothetical protein
MADAVVPATIPPQIILLALESGDLIFFFAHNVGAEVKFITNYYRVGNKGNIGEPAMHLKVDPSSRYVAVALL